MAKPSPIDETPEQVSETHYEVLAGSLGNAVAFGPFEKGDIVPESALKGEHKRLLNTVPPSIKVATRQVVINEPVTAPPPAPIDGGTEKAAAAAVVGTPASGGVAA